MDANRRLKIEENLRSLRALAPVQSNFKTEEEYLEAVSGFRHRIGPAIQHGEFLIKHTGTFFPASHSEHRSIRPEQESQTQNSDPCAEHPPRQIIKTEKLPFEDVVLTRWLEEMDEADEDVILP